MITSAKERARGRSWLATHSEEENCYTYGLIRDLVLALANERIIASTSADVVKLALLDWTVNPKSARDALADVEFALREGCTRLDAKERDQ